MSDLNPTRRAINPIDGATLCAICCADADYGWSAWITQELEDYALPPHLVGRKSRDGHEIPARLGKVRMLKCGDAAALDHEDLNELSKTSHLLVICSPHAALSARVNEMVRNFKVKGGSERLLAVIVDGDPAGQTADDGACFPAALRHELDAEGDITDIPAEPLAADFRIKGRDPGWYDLDLLRETLRKIGMSRRESRELCEDQGRRLSLMKLKVVAGILALDLGELTERDKARQLQLAARRARSRRSKIGAVATLLIALAVAANHTMRRRGEVAEAQQAEARAVISLAASAEARRAAEQSLRQARAEQLLSEARLRLRSTENGPADLAKAKELLLQAAEMGLPAAHYELGRLMLSNAAGKASPVEALAHIQKAVDNGDLDATELLAGLREDGEIVACNMDEAVRLSQLGASKNHGPSMTRLGYLMERGYGGDSRRKECIEWYAKADAAGDPEGTFALFMIYHLGRPALEIRRDPALAMGYLEKAASKNSPRALAFLAHRDPNAAPDRVLLERGAALGDSNCMWMLGRLHLGENGGSSDNTAMGERLLEQSAGLGNPIGAYILARHHMKTTTPSPEKARKWMLVASGRLKPSTQYQFGLFFMPQFEPYQPAYEAALMLADGYGGAADIAGAIDLLTRGAQKGSARCQLGLGALLADGRGGLDRQSEGLAWIDKAAAAKLPEALLLAGKHRIEGKIAAPDLNRGKQLLTEAANLGATEAERILSTLRKQEQAATDRQTQAPVVSQDMPVTKELAGAVKTTPSLLEANRLIKAGDVSGGLKMMRDIAAGLAGKDPELAYDAMLQLAGTYEFGRHGAGSDPALAYFWYQVADLTKGGASEAASMDRLKKFLSRQEAADSTMRASIFIDKCRLQAAADACATPPANREIGEADRVSGTESRLSNALKSAQAVLAGIAQRKLDREKPATGTIITQCELVFLSALQARPDSTDAAWGMSLCAEFHGKAEERFYWALRAGQGRLGGGELSAVIPATLARMYHEGWGVPPDKVEAEKWAIVAGMAPKVFQSQALEILGPIRSLAGPTRSLANNDTRLATRRAMMHRMARP